jgi:transcriptional regulator
MYIPDLYKNENQTEIEKLIHENGFAILVNQINGKLWATHIPLHLENKNEKQFLVGHVSKLNPQAESFKTNDDVLAIFSGSHSYISSSWYDHENVPTWNYLAVHVYGKLKLHSYEESIEALKRLVDKYEANLKILFELKTFLKKPCVKHEELFLLKLKLQQLNLLKNSPKIVTTRTIKILFQS